MKTITRRGLAAVGAGAALGTARRASAQAWPGRPVTIIVPWPAGGATDALARGLARHLGDAFGQPFVVENRSGATGNIGTQAVARATPDGQTLLVTTNGPITNNTLLYRSMPYDPFRDLAPIGLLADLPILIATRSNAPFRTLAEMIEHAKANPRKINCGIPGTGAAAHLASELLQHRAGIRYTQVPYRGSAPLTSDLLGGAVDMAFDLVTTYVPHIQSGALRALGITSAQPLPLLPEVQPIAAQGLPGYEATGWIAVLGPARLPAEIVQRVNAATNAFLAKEETRAILTPLGLNALGGTPDDLARKMQAEVALWRPIVQAAGITLE
jgi:tripartite-type tricarboxylate transporter receptor subunit TctC